MTKVDIFSGFLGAGKTTLIKKLIQEVYNGEKVVLIENEFGDIGIDGEFLKDSGIQINELNSGCICCSLVGDFSKALKQVIADFSPDRIVIEPSGVGKLSDVIRAVKNADSEELVINGAATVVDANKCKMYMKNFGEFFNDQINNSGCIILSHTGNIPEEKLQTAIHLVKESNPNAVIISTPWEQISGADIQSAIERKDTIEAELKKLAEEEICPECGHHHHHHDDDEDEEHYHHCHHHDDDEHEHHNCHNHHDDEHEHHHCHHHDDDEHEHHHEHHHHHADEVFTSYGAETAKKYSKDELSSILSKLSDETEYGFVLRAKGIVASDNDKWLHFDYVPGEPDIRYGAAGVCGRICVIGSKINEDKIKTLFGA